MLSKTSQTNHHFNSSLRPTPSQSLQTKPPTQTRAENWDKLCPLSDIEKQSIQLIQKSIADRPLPVSLTIGRRTHLTSLQNGSCGTPNSTRSSSPSGTPYPLLKLVNSSNRLDLLANHSQPNRSRSSTIQAQGERTPSQHQEEKDEAEDPLVLQEPIHTIEAFNDWFSHVSSMMDADSESDYLNYLSVLSIYTKTCDNLLSQVDHCRGYLREIQANWKFVDENSRSLEKSCEGMLDDQKLLTHLNHALTERLNYFRRLEEAQRLLSMSGEAEIVKGEEFLPMLDQLDVCLEFMKSNRHFRDADLYLVRFQQCLTRSMTLIKLHFINSIRSLAHSVQEKLQGNDQSDSPAVRALLFSKFEAASLELRPLISELEKRSAREPDEYAALLSELFFTWFGVRTNVLSGRVRKEISRMEITHQQLPDVIKLATTGCNYLRAICGDEWKLFKSFFQHSGDEEVFTYLESLCDYLYDLLRPQILHESKLDVLCELGTIVNSLIAIDSDLCDDVEPPLLESPTEIAHPQSTRASKFRFSTLLKPILQDVQTRLVFRAQAIIQSEVAGYQPKAEDLDYPKKLVKCFEAKPHKSKVFQKPHRDHQESFESEALRFRLPPDDIQELWYPTLRKTLWVLSKLHTYVNDAIFEDFAGEAVGICSQSIINAAKQINSQPSNTTQASSSQPAPIISTVSATLDNQLFIIRHLLVLKNMIQTVDVIQIDRAVDLGPITDMLRELMTPSGGTALASAILQLRPTSFLQHLSRLGGVGEKTIDSKSDLDKRLKETCASFIGSTARMLAGPLESFLGRCQTFLATTTATHAAVANRDLPSQEWATSEVVVKLYDAYMGQLQAGIGMILNKMILYLEDEKAINVIFPPLQSELMEIYRRFFNLIRSEYDSVTTSKIGSMESIQELIEAIVYNISEGGREDSKGSS